LEEAQKILKKCGTTKEPFFMYFAAQTPHSEPTHYVKIIKINLNF